MSQDIKVVSIKSIPIRTGGSFDVYYLEGRKESVNKSKKCSIELEVGCTYTDVKWWKSPKDKWYINDAKLKERGPAPQDTPQTTPKATGSNSGASNGPGSTQPGSREDGQARGNYRTNMTNYIIACLAKDIKVDTGTFNTILKKAEADYFGEDVPKVTDSATDSVKDVASDTAKSTEKVDKEPEPEETEADPFLENDV